MDARGHGVERPVGLGEFAPLPAVIELRAVEAAARQAVSATWRWECDPDEEPVIGGAPPAFVDEVEKKADELVRAAS